MSEELGPAEPEEDGAALPTTGKSVPLIIESSIIDEREGEELAITVTNLPDGARLSAGRNNGDRTWSLIPRQLAGLEFQPPAGSDDETFTLNIRIANIDEGLLAATIVGVFDVELNLAKARAAKVMADAEAKLKADAKEAESGRRKEEEKRRQAEMETRLAEAEEKRRQEMERRLAGAEAKRTAEIERRLAEAESARQAELEQRLVEAFRKAEEEKLKAEALRKQVDVVR